MLVRTRPRDQDADHLRGKAWRFWGATCCIWVQPVANGSGGVLPTNSAVVIPFQNVDRRKNGGAEIPSQCGKGHPLTPGNVRQISVNTAGAVGSVVASAVPRLRN